MPTMARIRSLFTGPAGYDRAMPERHFPSPWFVEELDSCFVVKDLNGQTLAYTYFEKEPRRRRQELLGGGRARRAPWDVCG